MQTFKEHLTEQEELNELFGSLPFIINTIKWQAKNRKAPAGESTWRFKYNVPDLLKGTSAYSANNEGIFEYKGTYKKALKALFTHMKVLGGNIKQAKVDIVT